jgi:hypothetical protein
MVQNFKTGGVPRNQAQSDDVYQHNPDQRQQRKSRKAQGEGQLQRLCRCRPKQKGERHIVHRRTGIADHELGTINKADEVAFCLRPRQQRDHGCVEREQGIPHDHQAQSTNDERTAKAKPDDCYSARVCA